MLNESNLHDYQKLSVNKILKTPHIGLFISMGLGKTVSTLTAINRLIYEELDINKVLVIAPKRVTESVWHTEIAKWDHLKHLTYSKVTGTEKQRKAALAAKADIYLISRDNVSWLCGQYGGGMLPFDMLVIDESSSFKNHASQRFKALKQVQPCFKRVVILTGTPAPNSLIDLWPQLWLLDRGQRLGKTISFYRDNYFRKNYSGFGYTPQQDTEDRVHNKIKDICFSLKVEDYLTLPERIDTFIEIDLPKDIKKRYDDFEREKVLEMAESGAEDISVLNAAALSNKLLQFAGGAVYDEDRNVHEVHDLKLDAAEEFIEAANGKPVLILYSYQHEYDRLVVRLKKYKPVKLATDQHVKDWNAGKLRVVLGHPASMGHGLNLQEGNTAMLWFSLNWSLELYQQANTRLWRQGRKYPVIIGHLICKDTFDENVKAALERKEHTQNDLINAIKAKIEKYTKN